MTDSGGKGALQFLCTNQTTTLHSLTRAFTPNQKKRRERATSYYPKLSPEAPRERGWVDCWLMRDWLNRFRMLCKLNKPDTGFIDHSIQYLQITSNTPQMFVWRLLCPSIIDIFCCDRINPSTERAAVMNAQLLFYDTAGGASGVEPPIFVGFLSYAARLNEPKMIQLVTAAS